MKAEVNKLELMFQKTDSDLDYIQYRLEYEIKTNHPDTAEKNPVTLLKELSAMKSQYQTLHTRFNQLLQSRKKLRTLSPFTKEEKTSAEQLKSFMSDL
ncbi:unnamed protein product [Nyctereutes procyonoides]|uniref:Protein FAM33A n=1 Tax=Nyctereutes procyonoides TaxID=34880 RepID=A0A811ZM07_NYCPR|nr:unnamed protein product [Nyctereutes procyonoides]